LLTFHGQFQLTIREHRAPPFAKTGFSCQASLSTMWRVARRRYYYYYENCGLLHASSVSQNWFRHAGQTFECKLAVASFAPAATLIRAVIFYLFIICCAPPCMKSCGKTFDTHSPTDWGFYFMGAELRVRASRRDLFVLCFSLPLSKHMLANHKKKGLCSQQKKISLCWRFKFRFGGIGSFIIFIIWNFLLIGMFSCLEDRKTLLKKKKL